MNATVEHLESVIETLIKDRDELQEKITAMCKAIPNYDWGGDSEKRIADLAKERNALTRGVDEWRDDYHELRVDHDKLMAAAKLALDALVLLNGDAHLTMMSDEGPVGTCANKVFHKTCLSIDALRQVGVK